MFIEVIGLSLSFLSGIISGVFFFNHLYKGIKKAILRRKKSTGFLYRAVPVLSVAFLVAYFFKYGVILFLAGFFISKFIYQYLIYKGKI